MVLNKKIVVATVIFVLILGAGGFFYGWPYYKQIQIKKDLERLADYIVKETPEGKIIESKDGEITVKVPVEWRIRKEKQSMIGPIYILDSELIKIYEEEMDKNVSKLIKASLDLKTGCLITIGYLEEKKSLEELEREINESMQNITLVSKDTFEFKEIDNHKSLLHVYDTPRNGYWMDFFTTTENKTHAFSMVFDRNNKEKCSQEFDKFLETVQIQ